MKAKILRCVDPKAQKKDETCFLCGQMNRGNKSRFDVELSCKYYAEAWICRSCSGEEGAMRRDTMIELPYLIEAHWHIGNRPGKTFWDKADTLNWIKQSMQLTKPEREREGVYIIRMPASIRFFECDGSNKQDKVGPDYDQLTKTVSDLKF